MTAAKQRWGSGRMNTDKEPVRIFLAEDHLPDVTLIKEALSSAGFEFQLERVADGEEALHKLLQYGPADRPHIIILDLNLPKITGFALLSSLNANPVLGRIPVLILTSSREASDREEAERRGAAAYLSKPPDLQDFIDSVAGTVKRLLGRGTSAKSKPHSRRKRNHRNFRVSLISLNDRSGRRTSALYR